MPPSIGLLGTEMSKEGAAAAGQFTIGGDIEINRLGFGAMRITGAGVWGEPADRPEALRTLRRLPELGINFIDMADSYGPAVSEELLREALHPNMIGVYQHCGEQHLQRYLHEFDFRYSNRSKLGVEGRNSVLKTVSGLRSQSRARLEKG